MTFVKEMLQSIAVLKNIERNLPLAERKLYFNALIKPIMLYGSCLWSTASEENANRISNLQKRAARVILNADFKKKEARCFLDDLTGCSSRKKEILKGIV